MIFHEKEKEKFSNTVSNSSFKKQLPPHFVNKMASYFGYDFTNVSIGEKSGLKEEGIAAAAYGSTIAFAKNTFRPETASGQYLIAHELAHIAQQERGEVAGERGKLLESPMLEQKAHHEAVQALQYKSEVSQALLPVTGRGTAVQPFRFVEPQPADYIQSNEEVPLFSTHKIVHFTHGAVPADIAPQEPEEALGTKNTPRNTGINSGVFRAVMKRIHKVQDDMTSERKKDNIPTDIQRYYSASGRISEPQLWNSRIREPEHLGQQPYIPVPKRGEKSPNQLKAASQFRVQEMFTNAHVPMMVSENNIFAVNALYPEPKEVYIQSAKVREVNSHMDWGAWEHGGIVPTQQHKVQLASFGNKIKIQGQELTMHKPIFISRPMPKTGRWERIKAWWQGTDAESSSHDSAYTHECDKFVMNYYNSSREPANGTNPRYLHSGGGLEHFELPWDFHVAGKLCEDNGDTLSLENGARGSFINQRGNRAGETAFGDDAFQKEMEKTWYFRIYGSEIRKQDIRSQTIARFSP